MDIREMFKIVLSAGAAFALAGAAVSCVTSLDVDKLPREIAFGVLVDAHKEATKATEVNTVTLNSSGFRASATTGSPGSESAVWTDVPFSVNADGFFTAAGEGKWWPAGGDPNYHFYGSNAALTHTAAGATVTVTTGTDVVCAYKETPVYRSVNSLGFEHVFGRLGDVTVTAGDGYAVSGISVVLTPRTGGTYNLRRGAGQKDASGWSGITTGSPVGIAAASPGTKVNDIWLVPGVYDLTIGWNATKGDYVKAFSGVRKTILIERGKVNSASAVFGGDAVGVEFAVSVSPWTSEPHSLAGEDFRTPPFFSVGETSKVQFAPGNLQAVIGSSPTDTYNYSASSWKFADHQWEIIGAAAGNTSFAVGTTVDLFGWVGASADYDSYGLCTNTAYNNAYYGTSGSDALKTDWGSIPGIDIWIGSGWRTLTTTEWNYLFTQRPNASSLYGQCQITTASGTVTGMLILPDNWTKPSNCTVTPGTGAFDRVTYSATAASGASNAWVDMESAGAVFLPAAGDRYGASVYDVGSCGYYRSSSVYDVNLAYYVYFYSGYLKPQNYNSRCVGFSVRLVRGI